MVVRRTDYAEDAVKAARSVLLELVHLLGEYRDDIVVIGGWVPELLLSEHIGTLDVDLALNHRNIQETGYKSITEILLGRGYRRHEDQPFMFYRTVKTEDSEINVRVDFLAGEYQGTGRSHRTQRIQDMRARKVRGCDLVFELTAREVRIEGELPEGGHDSGIVRVASLVSFLVMKGMALNDRLKEKDASDIYFCLRNYPGGLYVLVEEFLPHVGHGLVQEGLRKIADKFASPTHIGPKMVADFDDLIDPEERALRERDAYAQVNYLLKKLGILD